MPLWRSSKPSVFDVGKRRTSWCCIGNGRTVCDRWVMSRSFSGWRQTSTHVNKWSHTPNTLHASRITCSSFSLLPVHDCSHHNDSRSGFRRRFVDVNASVRFSLAIPPTSDKSLIVWIMEFTLPIGEMAFSEVFCLITMRIFCWWVTITRPGVFVSKL